MSVLTSNEWDEFLNKHPNAHILQTREWGDFKAQFGWKPKFVQIGHCGALILFKILPLGFSIGYIPKGPVGLFRKELLEELRRQCEAQNAIVLYVEPDSWIDEFGSVCLLNSEFSLSDITIQPQRTIMLSLEGNETQWLERMKQKTRYNIRLAEKKGIKVEISSDISGFSALMKQTGKRDGFGVHSSEYYEKVYEIFSKSNKCELLMATFEGKPIAGLILFYRGRRAWYFYGASGDQERHRMPTYLLQWEAMRLAASKGCTEYDLWGIPDFDEDHLEDNFIERNEGLWGVYRFKRGFGGEIKRSAGVYQKIMNPRLYKVYQAVYKLRKGSIS